MTMNKVIRSKFRVKIKSLAEESRIIRKEEKRFPGAVNDSDRECLRGHRIGIVRDEQRATLLAFALLRGMPYSVLEGPGSRTVDIKAVMRVARSLSFCPYDVEDVRSWLLHQKEKVA